MDTNERENGENSSTADERKYPQIRAGKSANRMAELICVNLRVSAVGLFFVSIRVHSRLIPLFMVAAPLRYEICGS
jgi:hypothetical protein